MLTSISFLYGSEVPGLRRRINADLLRLSHFSSALTHISVVFNDESTFSDDACRVSCQISAYLPDQRRIDICEKQSFAALAYDCAREKLVSQLEKHQLSCAVVLVRHRYPQ